MKKMSKVDLFETIIKAQSGVLFIKGRPGIGKTAMFQQIAKKNKWEFVDCRLAQMDETDFRFPYLIDRDGIKISTFAYPKWIHDAIAKPTLIMFDEINRASLAVRNAALQMLNERMIGDLKLGSNVFMVAVGNLGEKDGCEVEDFDGALNNRLLHYEYDLKFSEWCDAYANEHVISGIIKFIENNLEFYYRNIDLQEEAYPSPRTWTFLSDLIKSVYGKNPSPAQYIDLVEQVGHAYIGKSVVKFIRWLNDSMSLTIQDIVDRFPEIKKDVKNLKRDRRSELLNDLFQVDIKSIAEKSEDQKLKNIADFMNMIDADERVAFLNKYVEEYLSLDVILENGSLKKWLKNFADVLAQVKAFEQASK